MIVKIEFADSADLFNFQKYVEKAKAQDGTVGGLYAGLLCSALKRAKVSGLMRASALGLKVTSRKVRPA